MSFSTLQVWGCSLGDLSACAPTTVPSDLVCTQERILKIFRITGLTKVFGIHDTVDEAIAARKAEK